MDVLLPGQGYVAVAEGMGMGEEARVACLQQVDDELSEYRVALASEPGLEL